MKVGDLVRLKELAPAAYNYDYKEGDLCMVCLPTWDSTPFPDLLYVLHQRTGEKRYIGKLYLEKVS